MQPFIKVLSKQSQFKRFPLRHCSPPHETPSSMAFPIRFHDSAKQFGETGTKSPRVKPPPDIFQIQALQQGIPCPGMQFCVHFPSMKCLTTHTTAQFADIEIGDLIAHINMCPDRSIGGY
jgi:hypothetical protein